MCTMPSRTVTPSKGAVVPCISGPTGRGPAAATRIVPERTAGDGASTAERATGRGSAASRDPTTRPASRIAARKSAATDAPTATHAQDKANAATQSAMHATQRPIGVAHGATPAAPTGATIPPSCNAAAERRTRTTVAAIRAKAGIDGGATTPKRETRKGRPEAASSRIQGCHTPAAQLPRRRLFPAARRIQTRSALREPQFEVLSVSWLPRISAMGWK